MFWCLEEWQGRNKERRKEGLKKKTERVRVWRRNLVGKKRKKKKKKKEMPCVEHKKRGGRKGKKEEMLSQFFHNKF